MSTLALILAESTEHELAPLFAPPEVIAGIAAIVFLLMGLVTFSYRDVANRHRNKGRIPAPPPGDDSHRP